MISMRVLGNFGSARRCQSAQSLFLRKEPTILEHNPNDIVSPFYIPTDLKMLQTYMKKLHKRNLLHGKGKFYVIERDSNSLEITGTKPVAFSNMSFNDYYAVVNFAKWIADLQSNALKQNFITLKNKLDDNLNVASNSLENNKFLGKVNLHPHISVKLTDELLESIIGELKKDKLIDNLYDLPSLTEFFDFLISDKEFFLLNHDVVLQNLNKTLFLGLPEVAVLENQFSYLLFKIEEYGLDNEEQTSVIYFVNQYFDQLTRINVSKEPLSDSLLSALFNFYTNAKLYDDAFKTLHQSLKENRCLPRPSHMLNYLTNVDDPLKLVGVISMLQFNDVEENLIQAILNKVDCFEKIKFITSINPEDFFKNLSKLQMVLKKLEKLDDEELDNSVLYNRYLSYYLNEFDAFNKLKQEKEIDVLLFKLIIKSLYKVNNFYSIHQYLQLAEGKGLLTENLKNDLRNELSDLIIKSDVMGIEVLQKDFRDMVDEKLNL